MSKIKKLKQKLNHMDEFEIARILDTYYELGYDETVKSLDLPKGLLDLILE